MAGIGLFSYGGEKRKFVCES